MSENILLNEKAMWYKKKHQAFAGTLIITNDSISFTKDSIGLGGGLIGALISRKKSKGGELLKQPLTKIRFTKGRPVGKKRWILEVTDEKGEKFDFLFEDKWLSEVEEVVQL